MRIFPLISALLACGGSGEPKRSSEAAPAPPTYAGSQSCAECHETIYSAWAQSHHHLAERGQVIGVAPLRQSLVDVGSGRLQVAQEAWDVEREEYFDVFADGREPGEWGHWTGRGMTWNSMCAACHNTGLTKGYRPATDTYETERAEQGVGCEACHGKSSAHVAGGKPPLRDPGVDTCGSCHARRAPLTEDFQPGDALLDHYVPSLPDLTETYWADGQVLEEDFEYVSFLSSRMHEEGVTCIDCHDPHSGGLRRQGDDLCLHCHATQETFEPHANHQSAVACVDCHMPVTVYMQRDPRRDHGFSVPDPALTASLGIPNACDRCHEDTQPPAWAHPERRPQRARTVALAGARAGDPAGLVQQARSDPSPFWRAVAAGALGPWAMDPEVGAVLGELGQHPEPLVRFAAAGSYAGALVVDDPLRAVRVQSQRALIGQRRPTDRSMADLRAYLELNRDQPAPAVELGNWWLLSGSTAAGIAEIRRAITLDPGSAAHRAALARALAQVGRVAEARRELEVAAEKHPESGELHYLLALALSDLGQLPEAVVAMERVVALEPERSRAWYNLGVARQKLGREEAAIEALTRCLELDPQSADAAEALRGITRPGSSGHR